jgi:RimJ/RimL family protein N-acetyltransferase
VASTYKAGGVGQAGRPAGAPFPEGFLPSSPACREAARQGLYSFGAISISFMEKQPILATGRLLLRPFTLADAPEVQRLAGDYAVAATTLLPYPYPDGLAEAWIASLCEGAERGEAAAFAVTLAGTGGLIGGVRLQVDPDHARGELGFWIAQACWGRGYATEAVRAVIGYGFSALGLHRVHAIHFSRNPASGRVMEKCGMVHEGRLRQHVRKWGVFEDVDLWGIISPITAEIPAPRQRMAI